MKIVLVHGRNQARKDPDELKQEWWAALARGCEAAGIPAPDPQTVCLPFYGDAFERLVSAAQLPLSEEIQQLGAQNVDATYLEFRAALIEEVRAGGGITDSQVRSELSETAQREAAPAQHEWIHGILRALDKYMPRMADGVVDLFTRDLWVYLGSSAVRDEVDELIAQAIGPEPTVVVGHSVGSVIAYSLLRRVHSHQIPRLVTLGSPLGLSAIRNQFRPLKFPDGVGHWFNGYDERDLVALHGLGPELFPVEPHVRNEKGLDNQTRNCHGMVGYLEKPQVARAICIQPVATTESSADPAVRQA